MPMKLVRPYVDDGVDSGDNSNRIYVAQYCRNFRGTGPMRAPEL